MNEMNNNLNNQVNENENKEINEKVSVAILLSVLGIIFWLVPIANFVLSIIATVKAKKLSEITKKAHPALAMGIVGISLAALSIIVYCIIGIFTFFMAKSINEYKPYRNYDDDYSYYDDDYDDYYDEDDDYYDDDDDDNYDYPYGYNYDYNYDYNYNWDE